MTLDSYAPCPCGSGKKLKFCKCIDQPQELETIVRLIEGDQDLAALDRINQLLAKTPNAAWLLAIKGELCLKMNEADAFNETAVRFLKLKPSNPLALMMRAITACFKKEKPQEIAHYLLDSLAESRENLPSLTIFSLELFCDYLNSQGMTSASGFWFELLSMWNNQGKTPMSDADLNLLVKGPVKLVEVPAGAAWQERVTEVDSLMRSFRYAQAETKLRSILRDYPDQPSLLTRLVRAQYAQVDQATAFDNAKKLADCHQLSLEDRAYYLAYAFEIEPDQKSLGVDYPATFGEIDSEDRAAEALSKLDNVQPLETEEADYLRHFFASYVGDEVPARRLYQVFSRSIKSEQAEGEFNSATGLVCLFGKQTDRPARAMAEFDSLPNEVELIQPVLNALQIGKDLTSTLATPREHTYVRTLSRQYIGHINKIEQIEQKRLADYLQIPFKVLGNQTLEQAARDDSKKLTLAALLTHLEGEQGLMVSSGMFEQLYQRSGLIRPKVAVDYNAPNLKLNNIIDIERISIKELSNGQLQGLIVRAAAFGAARVVYWTSKEILNRQYEDDSVPMVAYSTLCSVSPLIEEKLDSNQRLYDAIVKAGGSPGEAVLQRVSLLASLGRAQEAQATMMTALQKHPQDPILNNFAMQMAQRSRGQAMPMQSVSQEPSSGLVLPGQDTPSEGKSKLWLPGS